MEPIKDKRINLRVTEEMEMRIKERAKEEGRAVSNFVLHIVTDYLDRIDEAKKLIDKNRG